MAEEISQFCIWLLGMFGLIGIVCERLFRFIQRDSWHYDENFLWFRKLKE